MPKLLRVELTPEERQELEEIRDHHKSAYLRERAAAIIKVAEGQSARQVALHGLLKRRHHTTVEGWVKRYNAERTAGLQIRPGRGRKPSFSPSVRERSKRA